MLPYELFLRCAAIALKESLLLGANAFITCSRALIVAYPRLLHDAALAVAQESMLPFLCCAYDAWLHANVRAVEGLLSIQAKLGVDLGAFLTDDAVSRSFGKERQFVSSMT